MPEGLLAHGQQPQALQFPWTAHLLFLYISQRLSFNLKAPFPFYFQPATSNLLSLKGTRFFSLLWLTSGVVWNFEGNWKLFIPPSDPHNSLILHSFTGSNCFDFLTSFPFICSLIAKAVGFCKPSGNTIPNTTSLALASGDVVEMLIIPHE